MLYAELDIKIDEAYTLASPASEGESRTGNAEFNCRKQDQIDEITLTLGKAMFLFSPEGVTKQLVHTINNAQS